MRLHLFVFATLLFLLVTGCSNGISYIRGSNIGYSVCDNNRLLTSARENDAYSWSSDGNWLAYTRKTGSGSPPANSLYVRDMQTVSDRELVNHRYGNVHFYFDWSPDNDAIVFEHDVCLGCNANISKINLITGDLRLMTPLSTNDMQPDWSPLGGRITFVSQSSATGADIYWMNSNATGRSRMTNTTDNDNYPVWSPDASHIAFIRSQISAPRHYSIASISRSELAGRINTLVSGFNSISYLSWSPDGTQLLFHGREPGMSQYAVYTVNADGSQLINLSLVNNGIYREIEDMFPAWSPDGNEIAFTRSAHFTQSGIDINARGMLFKMKSDGSDKERITDQEFVHTTSWRPKDILCF